MSPNGNASSNAHPDTSFFHRAGWSRVIERSLGHQAHYRCAWRGGRLVGILPLIHVPSRLFGNALVALAFGVYGGIAADDDEATRALAEDAARLGESLGVGFVELRHETARDIPWLAKPELYFAFRRELLPDAAANLKAIPRKKRADLRKAIADPALTVTVGTGIESFFRIYAESQRNLGTPVLPLRFYAAIAEEFGPAVEISTVAGGQGPVAALMTYYFKDRAMPYYGGATPAARPLHAYDLIYWRLIGRALERGCRNLRFRPQQARHGRVQLQDVLGLRAHATSLPVPSRAASEPTRDQSAQPQIPAASRGLEKTALAAGQRHRPGDRAPDRLAGPARGAGAGQQRRPAGYGCGGAPAGGAPPGGGPPGCGRPA